MSCSIRATCAALWHDSDPICYTRSQALAQNPQTSHQIRS